ncbi:MAG: type III secretion inner membrane ring lipoprotein SctJ [Verrucomicrobia bacterium]|nr:type III secretion inner membrane ring lipoprotein SctJ [Verrucomicrobiota bacterium]MBS0636236.1 type III secretion inner membrane ring lipoprotein SctJ [Verrucomicrobiota bacterium]
MARQGGQNGVEGGIKELLSPSSFFREKSLIILFFLAIIAFAMTGCESNKTIVNGLDEREANEILVLLARENIPAYKLKEKEGGGGGGAKVSLWDIAVDAQDANRAMAILSANGLPRRRGQNLIELFSSGGLVPSDMQEKIRYQAGLADSIASTIRKIDGIVDADVQLSFPEEDPLNPNAAKGQITASVYVKHTGVLDDPNSHLITKIKRLVASSVAGLSFDNVTVIPDRTRFSEMNMSREMASQQDLVKVWTLIIARESLTRFQTIFFTLSLLVLLLAFCTFWTAWKLLPLLKKRGGIKELFHLSPLPDEFEAAKPEGQEPPKEEQKVQEEPKGPKVQENVEPP